MGTLSLIIGIIFAILQIILFIKIWIMTNHVRQIRDKYLYSDYGSQSSNNSMQGNLADQSNDIYQRNTLVVELKTEKQMRIVNFLENGKYSCTLNGMYAGDFDPSEIMEFNEWVNKFYNK